MAQPHRAAENQHKVRVMFGNGLQKGIWADFQKRFGVKIMGEFYGATEGNCNISKDIILSVNMGIIHDFSCISHRFR